MAHNRIMGDIYSASNPSASRYSSSMSGMIPDSGLVTGVTADITAWTPLNPSLYMRYFTEFNNNPITKSAFREKINTGFAGGFSVRLGPYSQKSDPSLDLSRHRKRSVKNKDTSKRLQRSDKYSANGQKGQIGKNSAVSRITKDTKAISHGPEVEWIEALMEKAESYRDMFGMVAFRRRVNPMNPEDVRIEIVEAPYGYFIGKMGDDGRIEYGFVLHSSKTNNSAPSAKGNAAGATNEPDPNIKVFVWPGQEPIVGMSAPFRCSMSAIYNLILEMKEMWQNELEADFKRSHPVWVTQNEVKAKGPSDITEHELFLEVTGQLNVTESRNFHERARVNAEMSSTASSSIRERNQSRQSITQRRLGLGLDNTETVITRLHSYQDNHYVSPMGTSVGKGPETKMRSDIISIMEHKIKQIGAVFGVPLYSLNGQGQGRNTAVGSRGNMDNFRKTLVEMRKNISLFVEHAYVEVVAKVDKEGVANLITDISMAGNREEVLVRKYVQEIIKNSLPQEIMERYVDAQRREMPLYRDMFTENGLHKGSSEGGDSIQVEDDDSKKTKKKAKTSDGVVMGLMKPIEEENKDMAYYYQDDLDEKTGLSPEQLRTKMAMRTIFKPKDGPGKSSAFHDPKSARIPYGERNSANKILRNYLNPSRKRKESAYRSYGDNGSTQTTPSRSAQSEHNPYIGEEELEESMRYEREIKDHLDEIAFRDKLEEAKWRQLTAVETLFDNRVSRLLSYALNNYKVALNPQLIRNALEKYANIDPSIDPSKEKDFTILSRSTLTPIEDVENVIVDDVMSQRKEYMEGILDDPKPLTVVWDSAPIPDVELIIKAGEKGLLPVRMVGRIISNEMGIEDVYEYEKEQEDYKDKEIENFLKKNKERLGISMGGGRSEITSAMSKKKDSGKDKTNGASPSSSTSTSGKSGKDSDGNGKDTPKTNKRKAAEKTSSKGKSASSGNGSTATKDKSTGGKERPEKRKKTSKSRSERS